MLLTTLQWLPFTLTLILAVFKAVHYLRASEYTFPQKISILCLIIYLTAIAGLCLTPTAYNFDQSQPLHYSVFGPVKYILVPFQHVDLEWWLNILMTIPFGILISLVFPKITWRQIILIGLLAGVTIETSQFLLDWLINIHRWVETDDVLTNWLGVLVGYAAIQLIKRTVFNRILHKFQI